MNAVWVSGEWDTIMLGGGGQSELDEFWEHESNTDWVLNHPATKLNINFAKAIPFFLHGDDVAHTRNDKTLVVSMGSALCRLSSWYSHLLLSVMAYRWVKKGVSTTELYLPIVWSCWWMLWGEFPPRDCRGEIVAPYIYIYIYICHAFWKHLFKTYSQNLL